MFAKVLPYLAIMAALLPMSAARADSGSIFAMPVQNFGYLLTDRQLLWRGLNIGSGHDGIALGGSYGETPVSDPSLQSMFNGGYAPTVGYRLEFWQQHRTVFGSTDGTVAAGSMNIMTDQPLNSQATSIGVAAGAKSFAAKMSGGTYLGSSYGINFLVNPISGGGVDSADFNIEAGLAEDLPGKEAVILLGVSAGYGKVVMTGDDGSGREGALHARVISGNLFVDAEAGVKTMDSETIPYASLGISQQLFDRFRFVCDASIADAKESVPLTGEEFDAAPMRASAAIAIDFGDSGDAKALSAGMGDQ